MSKKKLYTNFQFSGYSIEDCIKKLTKNKYSQVLQQQLFFEGATWMYKLINEKISKECKSEILSLLCEEMNKTISTNDCGVMLTHPNKCD